jgi:(p)ppGpp synthase/HD superfamily hydrolase
MSYVNPETGMVDRIALPRRALVFAMENHGAQRYGDQPYLIHLFDVVMILREFGWTKPELLAAGLLHDVLEDTPVNYHGVKDEFGAEVAEIVYACTDELGRSRKDRKLKTMASLREWTVTNGADALIVKLADWIANVRDCHRNEPKKLQMYQKDWDEFISIFRPMTNEALDPMWEELIELLKSIHGEQYRVCPIAYHQLCEHQLKPSWMKSTAPSPACSSCNTNLSTGVPDRFMPAKG